MTATVTITHRPHSTEDLSITVYKGVNDKNVTLKPGQHLDVEINPEDEVAIFTRRNIIR